MRQVRARQKRDAPAEGERLGRAAAADLGRVPARPEHERDDARGGQAESNQRQFDFDGVFLCVDGGVDRHAAQTADARGEFLVDGDRAEGRLPMAGGVEAGDVEIGHVDGAENDDGVGRRDGEGVDGSRGGGAAVDPAGVRDDAAGDGPADPRSRRGVAEEGLDGLSAGERVGGIEASGQRGRAGRLA